MLPLLIPVIIPFAISAGSESRSASTRSTDSSRSSKKGPNNHESSSHKASAENDRWVPSWAHESLDKAGLVPGLGHAANGLNAVLYMSEGDVKGAATSCIGMVPGLGQAAVMRRLGRQVGGKTGARAAVVTSKVYL